MTRSDQIRAGVKENDIQRKKGRLHKGKEEEEPTRKG